MLSETSLPSQSVGVVVSDFGASESSPLGTIAKFAATQELTGLEAAERQQSLRLARLYRWALQSESRRLLPRERVHDCLRTIIPGRSMVEVWHSPANQSAHLAGLHTCSSVWTCPLCAAKISERRRIELQAAISYATSRGLAVYLATYTVAHTSADSLRQLLDSFLSAIRQSKGGRASTALRQACFQVGTIRALEVTYGEGSGWHPHCHELVFLPVEVEVERYERFARSQWKHAAATRGLTMNEHGFRLDRTFGAVEDYVAKWGHEPAIEPWGVEAEMTKAHIKRGRGEARHTPFGLLGRSLLADDAGAAFRFREFASVFRGRSQLQWSRGLHELLADGDAEISDEALAAARVEDAVLLGLLTRAQWRGVLLQDARGELLEVARSGDWSAVVAFLGELGIAA